MSESIHIASVFVVAGFSHVLATLWESDDYACRQVAWEFYSHLFDSLCFGLLYEGMGWSPSRGNVGYAGGFCRYSFSPFCSNIRIGCVEHVV